MCGFFLSNRVRGYDQHDIGATFIDKEIVYFIIVNLKVKTPRRTIQRYLQSSVSCSTNEPSVLITIMPPLGLNETINLVYRNISSSLLMGTG